jgi:hypothetical protein
MKWYFIWVDAQLLAQFFDENRTNVGITMNRHGCLFTFEFCQLVAAFTAAFCELDAMFL